MAASTSDCSITTRSDSSPVTEPPAASWPAGPRSWIWSRQRRLSVRDWHQSSIVPTSVTRAARLTGTRSAFALRLTRIRLCKRRELADRVGVGFDECPGLVVGPDRAAGERENDRLPHQEVEIMAGDRDLFSLLSVARYDAEPRLIRPRRFRARRKTTGPSRRRSGCLRRAARLRNRPPPGPRPDRAKCW